MTRRLPLPLAFVLLLLLATGVPPGCGRDPARTVRMLSADLEHELGRYRAQRRERPPLGVPEKTDDGTEFLRRALADAAPEFAARAAACRRVGPVLDPGAPEPVAAEEAVANRLVAEGLDGILVAMRFGADLTVGRGFERLRAAAFRIGMRALAGKVADGSVAGTDGRRVEDFLAEMLSYHPPARDAWWPVSLAEQMELGSKVAADPEADDPRDAWLALRRHLDPDRPDLPGLRTVAKGSDDDALVSAAARVLLAAERMPDLDAGLRRNLEAVILAIRVNRYRAEHGDWPSDLEAVRPDTVPASPGGAHWKLATDPETKRPGIFLEGGRRFGRAQTDGSGFHDEGPARPLFGF